MTNLIQYARLATGDPDRLAAQLADGQEWAEARGHLVIARFSEVLDGLARHSPTWMDSVVLAMDTGAAILIRDRSQISDDPLTLQRRLNTLKALGIELLIMNDAA